MSEDATVELTVQDGGREVTFEVETGQNLREALLDAEIDVYGSVSRVANCGGRGLCGTCGVRIDDAPAPTHWHDSAAERWGYPRLSCQVTVEESMTVQTVEKLVWGQLLPHRSVSDQEQS